jgi:hypothetical protein
MTDEGTITDKDLLEMQFDYAWKWFEFHATQRTTMFNYFIVFSGFIFAAISQLFKISSDSGTLLLAAAVATIGGVVSIIFCGFDHRNAKLGEMGQLYLMYFEKNFFDPNKERFFPINPTLGKFRPDAVGVFNLKSYLDTFDHEKMCAYALNKVARHRVLIPMISILIALTFFTAAVVFFLEYRSIHNVPIVYLNAG